MKSVVIGVDFSPPLSHVGEWVRRHIAPGAAITLVHAYEPAPLPGFLSKLRPATAAYITLAAANMAPNVRKIAKNVPTNCMMRADSICVHSDTPGAVDLAKAVHEALQPYLT